MFSFIKSLLGFSKKEQPHVVKGKGENLVGDYINEMYAKQMEPDFRFIMQDLLIDERISDTDVRTIGSSYAHFMPETTTRHRVVELCEQVNKARVRHTQNYIH